MILHHEKPTTDLHPRRCILGMRAQCSEEKTLMTELEARHETAGCSRDSSGRVYLLRLWLDECEECRAA